VLVAGELAFFVVKKAHFSLLTVLALAAIR